MDKSEQIVVGGVVLAGGVVAIITSMILLALCSAYVFTYMWAWFIVPFFNLPALSLAQAYGLMLTINVLKSHRKSPDKVHEIYFMGLLGPFLILAIGYVVKGYL